MTDDTTGSQAQVASTDSLPDRIATDDPCPNCGEPFGRRDGRREHETLPDRIEGDAEVRRLSDGTLCFEVEFPCPTCGQEFVVEDLSDGAIYPE